MPWTSLEDSLRAKPQLQVLAGPILRKVEPESVTVWLALRTVYAAARAWVPLRRCLPYSSYLVDLVPFPFREVHSIVFDQLLAPVAHYMSRDEVERCFAQSGLALTSLRWHHANSWSAAGRAGPSGREPIAAGS